MNVTNVCFLSSPVELSLVIRCAGSSVHCFAPDSKFSFCHCHAYLVLNESVFVLYSFQSLSTFHAYWGMTSRLENRQHSWLESVRVSVCFREFGESSHLNVCLGEVDALLYLEVFV